MADKTNKRRVRLLIIAAAVAAALLLGWCSRGWFGAGTGSDEAKQASKTQPQPVAQLPVDAGPSGCRLRIDKSGVQLDSKPITIDDAVTACKVAGRADLVVTGESKYGAVEELKRKLTSAGVRFYTASRDRAP